MGGTPMLREALFMKIMAFSGAGGAPSLQCGFIWRRQSYALTLYPKLAHMMFKMKDMHARPAIHANRAEKRMWRRLQLSRLDQA